MNKYVLITKPSDEDINDAVEYHAKESNLSLQTVTNLIQDIDEAIDQGVMISITYKKDGVDYKISNQKETNQVITCPHCGGGVFVEQINCGIFRHASLKANLSQVNHHMGKEELDKLIEDDIIWGCGKPFKVDIIDKGFNVYECDYI